MATATWKVFSESAHLVENDKACCGADVDVSKATEYGAGRTSFLRNCVDCTEEYRKRTARAAAAILRTAVRSSRAAALAGNK